MAIWFPKIRVLAGRFKLGGTLLEVPYVTQDPWPSTTNDNPLLPLESEAWNIDDAYDWSQQDDVIGDYDELTYVAGVFDSAPVGPNQPPQSPEDAWDWTAEEPEIYVLSSGYQQADGIPQPVEDTFDWFLEEPDEDDRIMVGDLVGLNNNPLLILEDTFDWSSEEPDEDDRLMAIEPIGLDNNPLLILEDTWVYAEELADDEWIIDHNDDFDAISPDNNPLITVEDAFDWFAEEPDEDDRSMAIEPIGLDNNSLLILEDAWLYVEELADDEWLIDHNDDFDAVSPDNNPLLILEDAFDWSAEEPETYIISSGYQQADNTPQLTDDVFDWFAEEPDEDDRITVADPVVLNGIPQPVEDSWDHLLLTDDADDYLVIDDYVLIDANVLLTLEDAFDWSAEEPDEDDRVMVADPVGPNQIPNPVEDAWDHLFLTDDVDDYLVTDDYVLIDANVLLTLEDAFDWSAEEPDEDDRIMVADPVGLNGPPQPPEDAYEHFLTDDADDYLVIDDYALINNIPSAVLEDTYDWSAEEPETYVVSSGYQQIDGIPQPVEDTFDWFLEEPDEDDRAMVADAVAPAPPSIAPIYCDDAEQFFDEQEVNVVIAGGYQQLDNVISTVQCDITAELADLDTDDDDAWILTGVSDIAVISAALGPRAVDEIWMFDDSDAVEIIWVSGGYQQSDLVLAPVQGFDDYPDMQEDDLDEFFTNHFDNYDADLPVDDAWDWGEQDTDDDEAWILTLGEEPLGSVALGTPISHGTDAEEADIEIDDDEWILRDTDVLGASVLPTNAQYYGEDAENSDVDFDDDSWIIGTQDVIGGNVFIFPIVFSEEYPDMQEDDFDEFFTNHYGNDDADLPVADAWDWGQQDTDDEDFIIYNQSDEHVIDLPPTGLQFFGDDAEDADVEQDDDEWVFRDTDVLPPSIPIGPEQFFGLDAEQADVDLDDETWLNFATNTVGTDEIPNPVQDDYEHFLTDDADDYLVIDDYALVDNNPVLTTVEDTFDHFLTDDADDYLVIDDYVLVDNDPVITVEDTWLFVEELPDDEWVLLHNDDFDGVSPDNDPLLSLEDAFDHFLTDDADDYLVIDDYVLVDANALLSLEDVFEHFLTDDADDYYVSDNYTLIDFNLAFTIEDAFDWSAEEPDEDDRIMVADPVGANQPPNPVEDTWDWSAEEPDNDIDFYLDALATAATIPSQVLEDAFDWDVDQDEADAYFATLENYLPGSATNIYPAPSTITVIQYSSVMAVLQYSSVIIIQQ